MFKKRGRGYLKIALISFGILSIVLLILLGVATYIFLGGKNYDSLYNQRLADGEIINPVKGLTTEEAVSNFNEDFIYYFLVTLKVYNLKTSSIDGSKPLIQFYIENKPYYTLINKGEIYLSEGESSERDLIIYTNKLEVVKMMMDSNYIKQSFEEGSSEIELVSGNAELASKGYIKIYSKISGD